MLGPAATSARLDGVSSSLAQPAKAALIYDFDGTLARGNIQEHSLIPSIGMDKEKFWADVKQMAKDNDADEILCYMRLLVQLACRRGIPLTSGELRQHGAGARLFGGLSDGSWFDRINEFAASEGLGLEHYVISSGIFDMIAGCPIFRRFTRVFASRFMYDGDVATWPALAINYTTKTQFLFRINKGIDNCWDNNRLNSYTPDAARPIPFTRMAFIGDGDTDIPSMKMMTHQGGYSVAVYDPERDPHSVVRIHKLLSEDRVNFVAPADYSKDSQMEIVVRGILGRIARVVREKSLLEPTLT